MTTTHPTAAARVAVIGDIGGHSHQLRLLLTRLGVTFDLDARTRPVGHDWAEVDLAWPAGLRVVSVGDLVHRGPDSLGVLVLIDRLIEQGHWVQVVGNHEQLYVAEPVFRWNEHIGADAEQILRHWWAAGNLHPAVALTGFDRDLVVTHAGVTYGFWKQALGSPPSAQATVEAIADTVATGLLWVPGKMLGEVRNLAAGPVWAEAGHEVILSWVLSLQHGKEPCPFDQVHGHSTPYNWDRNEWQCPATVRPYVRADRGRRHTVARIEEATITGIDPTHGTKAAPIFAAAIYDEATIHTAARAR